MTLSRRQFIHSASVLSLGTLTGCACINPPLPRDQSTALWKFQLPLKPETLGRRSIIDAHGHFFNATDMQAGGYFQNAVLPGFRVDPSDRKLKRLWQFLANRIDDMAISLAPTTSSEWKKLDQLDSADTSPLRRQATLDTLILQDHEARSQAIIEALGPTFETAFNDIINSDTGLVRDRQVAQFTLSSENYRRLLSAEYSGNSADMLASQAFLGVDAKEAWRTMVFVYRMLTYRLYNIATYHKAFTQDRDPNSATQTVQVVDALVDFDFWMGKKDHACSLMQDQIILHERLSKMTNGYILPLVGFNPWSAVENGLDSTLHMVEDALRNRGFRGIKLYPANGFSANGHVVNAQRLLNGRKPPHPDRIQEALYAVYALCLKYGGVVMAHGNFSAGLNSDFKALGGPHYWRELMAHPDYGALKVNIGHFGGDYSDSNGRWADQFIEIMQLADNFYADLGYRNTLMDEDNAKALVRQLSADQPQRKAAERVLYGTDWLMLDRVTDWPSYADTLYANILNHAPSGSELADQVFFKNAKTLFGL